MGNACFSVLWFLLLIFVGLPIAGFCAGWYALLLIFTTCFEPITEVTDFLLKGARFGYFCAKCMMEGQSLNAIGDACK
ncbi:unnamed protein product [Cyprideis torosa]|uniref:Uncharacterized protein n=1 Tax=Cyprideis torosa TaxID=163714 RepID=A0A7R8WCE4_9CRUS|nr:unnamed protein product [Cyprideis torosa]CAG0893286.1 unnamed protein product [Cyprideis torosa]